MGDTLKWTLDCQVHTTVKSGITSDKIALGIIQLNRCTQNPSMERDVRFLLWPWSACVRTGSLQLLKMEQRTARSHAYGGHGSSLCLQRTCIITAEEGGQNKLDNYTRQVFTPKIWMNADFNMDYVKQSNWEGFLMETIWTEPSEHAPQRGPWKIWWPMVLLWRFWQWLLSFLPHPPDTGRTKFGNNGFIHFLATLHPS